MALDELDMKWVKLKRYCNLSGDTVDAVKHKRRAGIWVDGVHWRLAGDGRIWINVEAVEKWAETSTSRSRVA